MNKKILSHIACGLAITSSVYISFANAAPSFATNTVSVSVEVNQSQPAAIDWTKDSSSYVLAYGIGLPKNGVMAMARVAAIMDVQRNLLGILKGVQIDADTLMQDLIVQNDIVKRNISGLLTGAQIIDEGSNPDGSYYVQMRVPLYGASDSIASAVLPAVLGNNAPEPFPAVTVSMLSQDEMADIQSTNYSGVVIDADGMGLSPTFSPVIYDENGRAVYGANNIDPNYAIREGMVRYADDVAEGTNNSRAGSNPLVVKATNVRGGANSANQVNVVISAEDADRILLANEQSNILADSSVVFVK